MELLTRTYRDLRRLLGPNGWFTAAAAAVLISLEVVGRQSSSDLHDLLAAVILTLGAVVALAWHRQSPLSWMRFLTRLGQRVAGFCQRFAFEIGIDMRGEPPIQRGYPPVIGTLLVVLACWTVLIMLLGTAVPHGVRAKVIHFWYSGYLLAVMALWATLIAGILLAIFVSWALIHDAFITRFEGDARRSRRAMFFAMMAYCSCLLLASLMLPLWVPLAICFLAQVVNFVTMVIPGNADVQFLWRARGGSEVRSIPWGRWVACEFTIATLIIVNLVLTSCGPSILVGNGMTAFQNMPVTTTLGVLLAWLAPGALTGLVVQTVLGRTRDPARPCLRRVHIRGERLQAHARELERLFVRAGWQVRMTPAKARSLDVTIELVEPAASEHVEFEPKWPLKVSLEALREGLVLERLARRDEIQKRRRLVGGLERLFKWAARYNRGEGGGIWIAPHYWFVPGIKYDANDEERDFSEGTILSGIIGPPYHRVIPRGARHHVYTMMRALQIDLIFVEDGVSFRRFSKVLRMLFEIYDVHGGRVRAEERHFTGMLGTRVVIHEFVLDEPFKSEVYPEPSFDNLGRARILHVFRDRGKHEEPLEPPLDFTNVPMPSAAV